MSQEPTRHLGRSTTRYVVLVVDCALSRIPRNDGIRLIVLTRLHLRSTTLIHIVVSIVNLAPLELSLGVNTLIRYVLLLLLLLVNERLRHHKVEAATGTVVALGRLVHIIEGVLLAAPAHGIALRGGWTGGAFEVLLL